MNKFKVGDKVKVYDRHCIYVGYVESLCLDDCCVWVNITKPTRNYRQLFHEKQCRKLKKRSSKRA